MIPGQTIYQFYVNGLYKAAIGKGTCIAFLFQLLPHMLSCAHHTAHCQQRNILFLVKHLAFSVGHRLPEIPQSPVCFSPWIAHGQGTVILHGKFQHGPQLPHVFGSHDAHVGDGRKKGIIKYSLMGFPIAAHKACPVHRKQYGKVLDAYIMKDLVICPLQKGGIDRNHRF